MMHSGCDLCKRWHGTGADPLNGSAGDGEEFGPRLRISHSENTTATKTLWLVGRLGTACHLSMWQGGERDGQTAAKDPSDSWR